MDEIVRSPSARAARACWRSRTSSTAIEDEFTRKGLQLVVDGTDPELVREILEAEIDGMAARHKRGAELFEKAGGFAPTMGIIGTVMGLVHVLENLSRPRRSARRSPARSSPRCIGVGSANVVFLPVANRLKALSAEEVDARTLIVEGILADPGRRQPARRRARS